MSAQPSFVIPSHVFVTDREARKIKQNEQQLKHVINRILTRLEFPDKAARGVHGIHGALNGRDAIGAKQSFPAFIAHKFMARQMGFTGKEENCDQYMCRYLSALSAAQEKCGRKVFEIRRGGTDEQAMTSYDCDYIGEVALWVLVEAKASETWAKCPAAAVTDELIDTAINKLPVCEPKPPSGDGEADMANIIKGIWTKIETVAEGNIKRSAKEGIDPLKSLDKMYKHLKLTAEREWFKLRMSEENMRRRHTMNMGEIIPEEASTEGKNIGAEIDGGVSETNPPDEDPTPPQFDGGYEENDIDFEGFSETTKTEEAEPEHLTWALGSAAEGIAVLPLWGVSDGICDCPKGSECSTPGKHPHSRLARKVEDGKVLKGVYSATTDAETIREWFDEDPRCNFGLAMGGTLNLICVDVDPRNDGDATYYDLEIAHGPDAFTKTREKKTGGQGWHKLYRLSESIKPATGELKGKLGPGIDIKGAGGLIVAAGSSHESGNFYGPENGEPIAYAPEWIERAVRKAAAGEQPEKPVDFQAYRDRKQTSSSAARFFGDGERNNGLRDVMAGRWINGFAVDASDLYQQMLDVRETRCAEGEDRGASDAKLWEMVQRTVSKYSRGDLRGGAA
jgi:hypothetical protein